MRLMLRRKWLIIPILCFAFALAGTLKSREDYMQKLPVYQKFKCSICHVSLQPNSGSDLNNFGRDFKGNSFAWNEKLARMDSDQDGFMNGIEIGDENGDGVAEVTIERSNPGDRLNTPNSVDQHTWSVIKSLFKD